MSAERWGLVIGLITIVTIRVVDWFMPKGYHSLWAERHGTKTTRQKSCGPTWPTALLA